MSWREFWDEQEYLLDPQPMTLVDIWGIHNAPSPDERFDKGDEVWVKYPDAMDLVEWGVTTGLYMWSGKRFWVEVEVNGVLDWEEELNVWKCGDE